MSETKDRIIRTLDKGPLYLGALPLIVDAPEAVLRPALRTLIAEGKVTIDKHGTVKLT